MNRLANFLPIFSYIFHPIFVSVYGALFYFLVAPNATIYSKGEIYLIVLQVVILTILLPLSLFFLLISLGFVTSFTEASLKERKLPITIQAVLLFFLLQFNQHLSSLPALYYFFLGAFFSSVIAFLFVFMKFKASLHMIGISALATFIYGLTLFYNLPLINSVAFIMICVGFVASSRLFMQSHTNFELFVGLLIGLIPQISLWYFWL